MAAVEPRLALYVQAVFLLGPLVLLAALGISSLQLIAVSGLVGLLVGAELVATRGATPRWRRRLLLLVKMAVAGFVAYAALRLALIAARTLTA